MDWMQTLTVIGVFIGGFLFMMSRMDKIADSLRKEISDSNTSLRKDMDSKFAQVDVRFDALKKEISDSNTSLRKDMADLNAKVSNIEGQITQMTRPKIIHFRDEEEHKEN